MKIGSSVNVIAVLLNKLLYRICLFLPTLCGNSVF